MKCLFANPNIAPHVKETLAGYYEQGCLDFFYTSYYFDPTSTVNKGITAYFPAIARELKRRSVIGVPSSFIRSRPMAELFRVFSSRMLSGTMTDKIWEWSELAFDKWVARHLTTDVDWVHVSEHASLATLQKAKRLGIFSVYEQPSQHHAFFTDVVKHQMELYPALNDSNVNLLVDEKATRRNKRRDAELHAADLVLCNSLFTKKTLVSAGVQEQKILTVPLGFPLVKEAANKPVNDNIVFMYAGNLSLRKGIHLLLQAWKQLLPQKAELWLIGRKNLPDVFFEDLPGTIKIFPNIPHEDLIELYRKADVFVLPTLADGFGMVVTEAMSAGLPVITTTNCGSADLIDEKKDGLIISPESKEAIIEAIKWCLEHSGDLPPMGYNARMKASKYPWSFFRQQLVSEIVSKKSEWQSQKYQSPFSKSDAE